MKIWWNFGRIGSFADGIMAGVSRSLEEDMILKPFSRKKARFVFFESEIYKSLILLYIFNFFCF